jgi:hypothetical protein
VQKLLHYRLAQQCRDNRTAETEAKPGNEHLKRAKFFPERNFAIEARNPIEISKTQIVRPDREFEFHLLRQPVPCFCREIGLAGITVTYPQVSLTEFGKSDRRERSRTFVDGL